MNDNSKNPHNLNGNELASTGWKGVEPAQEMPLGFVRKPHSDDSDMTSMVDVTFLLLIFFMVTASFSLQKAMATPPSSSDQASIDFEEWQDSKRVVTISIDQFNTFTLTSEGHDPVEAASDQELRARLSDLGNQTQDQKVVIEANPEAWHEKVVTAWDAALAASFTDIGVSLSE